MKIGRHFKDYSAEKFARKVADKVVEKVRSLVNVKNIHHGMHFSDRYTPQEFFEGIKGPGEEEMALYGKVFMAMVHRS